MINRLPVFLLLFVLAFSGSYQSFAKEDYIKQGYVKQSRLPYSLHKFQLGISSFSASSYYKGDFVSYINGNYKSVYYDGPSTSKGGLGVTLGTHSRLLRMGKATVLTWDLDFMYGWTYWKGIGQGFYREREWNNGAVTTQMALPTGISLRFGSDAAREKNQRFCFNFGGGVMPMYNKTRLEDTGKKNPNVQKFFGLTPYMRFEVGIFAGICWKLRVNYNFGDFKLIDDNDNWHESNPFGVDNFNLRGKTGLNVSLIMMPFSYDWPDNGWWNNSRTSTKMWKGWKARNKTD